MKKSLIFMLLPALCLCLSACGGQSEPELEIIPAEVEMSGGEITAPTEEPQPTPDVDALAAELLSLMNELYENVRPGTAGTTLRLTAHTAALLDWCELHPGTDAVSKAVDAFLAENPDYSEEAEGLFASAADIAGTLLSDSADTLLEECGYTSLVSGWSPERAGEFFAALSAAFD